MFLLYFVAYFLEILEGIYYFNLTKQFTSLHFLLLYSVCSSLWSILPRCIFAKFYLFQMSGKDLW